MPALTSRAAARKRIQETFARALCQVIPPDEQTPLRGRTFLDFEEQVQEAGRAVMTALLEERAALSAVARQDSPGRCPHCGSERVYLEREATEKEILSPVGPLRLRLQQCRCRACNGSFSPSGQGLAAVRRDPPDPAGPEAGLPRGGQPAV
jgi:hypothetical protein